ncbi:MAG: hypothetical protein JZD40_04870 [Sulfolobus sp.]|nr:hypothetical protein [Sulfolobus sp.]
MSPEDKLIYSDKVPFWFNEMMCGLMLGDGNLRMKGTHALLSVQQVHSELTINLWDICFSLNLVINPVKTIKRKTRQIVYYFQTLTKPYFTSVYNARYINVNDVVIKSLPINIQVLITPLPLAHWIIGDGGYDGHGRGVGRVTLYTNNFTLAEVELLQSILLDKFGLKTYLRKVANADPARGYAIRFASESLTQLRSVCTPHIYPTLMYKLGL